MTVEVQVNNSEQGASVLGMLAVPIKIKYENSEERT
jgi:hypothetical protein